MIAANELRIGNWVNINVEGKDGTFDSNYQVEEIRKDVILFNNGIHAAYRMLYPIPLTEGILLKCGFEGTTGYDSIDEGNLLEDELFHIFEGDSVIDLYLLKKGEAFYYAEEYDSYIYRRRKLNGVHDLQNLYFALTGKELEVKL